MGSYKGVRRRFHQGFQTSVFSWQMSDDESDLDYVGIASLSLK